MKRGGCSVAMGVFHTAQPFFRIIQALHPARLQSSNVAEE
jgi:hypothetical protein